jgi:hypothetical protein
MAAKRNGERKRNDISQRHQRNESEISNNGVMAAKYHRK